MARFDEPIALREQPTKLARLLRLGVIVLLALTLGILGISLVVAISAN